jgi:hypothetical protein
MIDEVPLRTSASIAGVRHLTHFVGSLAVFQLRAAHHRQMAPHGV